MPSGRLALVIASSHFTDPTLQQLPATGADAAALRRVLADPAVGNFEVHELVDRPSQEVRRGIEAFFADRKRDDLLVLYFSGHGLKSDDGKLYLAMTDTERGLPLATTVPASFVNETMAACSSRRQVLILDCCHSGAFARGAMFKGGASADVREQFEGQGRVVLTASNAIQYAFVGDKLTGEGSQSVFTRHLVHGLETGEADLDGDGHIAVGELYEYVYARVIDETPKQRPGMWAFQAEGEIVIAQSLRGPGPQGPEEARLAEQYRHALGALAAGRWEDALGRLQTLAAERPNYRDVTERMRPLRKLANRMGRFGPAPASWRRVIYHFPIWATLLAIVLPNTLASVFNYAYNRQAIFRGEANSVFDYTATVVNGVAFPVGTALVVLRAWPVVRGLRRLRDQKQIPLEDLASLRRHSLRLGHYAAAVGVSLWALAGPIYPIAIYLGGGTMSLRSGIYFIVSLALGGLIAAAYPFFGVTFLWVRVLYPLLVQPSSTVAEDVAGLEQLDSFTWRYLMLAASVPMLVTSLALWVGAADERGLLAVLGLGGLAGVGLAFWLCRALQSDVKILKQAVTRSLPGVGEGK